MATIRTDVEPARSPDWRFVRRTVARTLTAALALVAAGVLASWSLWLAGIMLAGTLAALFRADRASATAWLAYLAGFAAFVVLRQHATAAGFPVRWAYPVELTRAALSVLPVHWLQARIGGALIDRAAIGVYLSYFVVPPLAALALFRHPATLLRYVAATLAVFAVAVVVHVLLPTAPPWLAAEQGHISPVRRVIWDTLYPLAPHALDAGYRASQNDVAAMPSVHMALTTLACLALAARWRWLRWPALLYALAMALAIVYLGEHYLIDGLAGAALALLSWRYVEAPFLRLKDRVPYGRPARVPAVTP